MRPAKLALVCTHGTTAYYLGSIAPDPNGDGIVVMKGEAITRNDWEGREKWAISCPRCRRSDNVPGPILRRLIEIVPKGTRSVDMATAAKIFEHLRRGHEVTP